MQMMGVLSNTLIIPADFRTNTPLPMFLRGGKAIIKTTFILKRLLLRMSNISAGETWK